MQDIQGELAALADYIGQHREALLSSWERSIRRDPELSDGAALPRSELRDNIPDLLSAFELNLRDASVASIKAAETIAHEPAAAHGVQRWKQGYNLREVTRELGKLNECLTLELDAYAKAAANFSLDALARAHQVWTRLCCISTEESVTQYFTLQQREAEGQLEDLEQALQEIRALERERGDLWRQAAHDLRGNLSVVANVTVGLTRHGQQSTSRDDFVRILMRNVTSLHRLLDDVTSLARLQAGRETRHIEFLDATAILQPLCESIRPLAVQRGLYLTGEGPDGLAVEGDAVKIRRIAQNLILNAVKYTHAGGITVTWGDSAPIDPMRWVLCIRDTGPGFHTASAQPIAAALAAKEASVPPAKPTPIPEKREASNNLGDPSTGDFETRSLSGAPGEGIGLSIVKRLCEMLDATIDLQSVKDVGTSFHIYFPRRYPD